MWVADMDFAAPPAIQNALADHVRHGVYGYTRVPRELPDALIAYLQMLGTGVDFKTYRAEQPDNQR